jgi:hypothetical protein
MKPYIFIFPSILFILIAITDPGYGQKRFDSANILAQVLKKHVKDGLVDYSGLKSNPGQLNEFLDQASLVTRQSFNSWNKNEQLAFLINLYNAATLALVEENYPVNSIKDIAGSAGGPWEQPVVNLFGENITLNSLESEVIRKNYPEPRVHFALVCAALGCPVLINKPYEPQILDEQLKMQTKAFLADITKNSIDVNKQLIKLSPIFDWYREDFISASGSVLGFVNPYFGNQANSGFGIEYTDYDWSLNDLQSGSK